jgi:GTP-binding protein
MFVDLPGYGYAAVERNAKLRWQEVMAEYLAVRRNLAGMVLLVDSRHGFTDLDRRFVDFVATRIANGSVGLVTLLTKSDKLSKRHVAKALDDANLVLGSIATEASDISLTAFSAFDAKSVGAVARTIRALVVGQGLPRGSIDTSAVADAVVGSVPGPAGGRS